ncbi:MAG TPA: HAD family phosphatase [Pirellulales bacterium]|nr:HAD family phosphatase [Pirellulales bacterium]
MPIRGLIFDLDGTLVDSGLDFEQMRCEMGLAPGSPLLESLASLSDAEAQRCRQILARHERAGAERAVLMPGVAEFLAEVTARGIRCAVFTRNGREIARLTLDRLALNVETIVAREDAPIKPNPTGTWQSASRGACSPQKWRWSAIIASTSSRAGRRA